MNKLRPGFYFSMYDAGPAVATIRLYEVSPDTHAPVITLPPGLPRRTLMVDWERQPTHLPADLVAYAKLMGYSAVSPVVLKWGFMHFGDPATGYDSTNVDYAHYWVTSEYTGFRLVNDESSPQRYELFSKTFPAGQVPLGPNGAAGGAGAGTYTVVVVGDDGLAVTDLAVGDPANAADWSVQPDLQVGVEQYGDRAYRLTAVPEPLIGSPWVQTAADSKASTADPLVTFTISGEATVYVAMNIRLGRPSWMDSSWTAVPTTGPAPAPAVPDVHSVHFQYLRETKSSGVDYIPRFEYGGSYNLPVSAQPIGADGEPAPPNRFGVLGHWGANLLNPDTYADLKVFLDSFIKPYTDNFPQLTGALWRIRSDRMQVSYGRDDVTMFGAETGRTLPPDLTDAELAEWASTGAVGEAYATWWHGRRAAFHAQLVALLRSYRPDLSLYYFNWDQDKFSMILPDLHQGAFYARVVEVGGPTAYAEDRTARAALTADDYLEVLRTGDFSGPYGANQPNYALRPELYHDKPGIRLLAPLNYLCYADKPEYVNYFQTADGLAVSNCVSYDEIASRYINPKFEANMVLPGGAPFSMAMELLAYYHGDARTLTYTTYTYGRGFAGAHRRFAQAFLALPAVPGTVVEDTPPDVRARQYPTANGVYVGIAYKGHTATALVVDLPGDWDGSTAVADLVTGDNVPAELVGGSLRINLVSGPMQLHALLVTGP